jgi:deoxyribonuclease V
MNRKKGILIGFFLAAFVVFSFNATVLQAKSVKHSKLSRIEAIKKLSVKPDVFIFDGQGIAHPRGVGIATHVGVLLGISTIGCAKSVLCGTYKEPGIEKGSWTPLIYNGKKVGVALRTRSGVKPVFVSVGNKIELGQCIEIVLNCCTKYRLPEPIRKAHAVAGEEMRKSEAAL